MPKKRKPSYLLHKPTGQARVIIDGKTHYLGKFGTQESRDRYDDLVADWLTKNGETVQHTLRVCELALLYMDHAESYYVKNGSPTSEVHKVDSLLALVVQRHGRTRVREFGPKALRQLRDAMVEAGGLRDTINQNLHRLRRVFRWAVSQELASVSIVQALETVEGLKRGRTQARESKPVLPVDDSTIDATLPFLPSVVADMVRLQRLTAMRPGECCSIRPCDVTFGTDGDWTYRPESHKTEHHDKDRIIFIGPKAQEVLRPYLNRDPDSPCFSPLESEANRNEEREANRETPMTPSQRSRKQLARPNRAKRDHYTKDSYRRAINRGCELAFGMPEELRNIPKTLEVFLGAERAAEQKRLDRLAAEWREVIVMVA